MIRLVVGAVCLGALPACLFDATVPAAATLLCASTADCPSGTVCARTEGRCASLDELVRGGTEVADVTVTPERAGPGMTVTTSFTIVEPLDVAPRVEMVLGTEALTTTLAAATGPSFSASAVVNAGMTSGPWAVRLSLVDAGGESSDVTLGVVDVDTAAPAVTTATLSDTLVVPDAPIELALSLTEPATVRLRASPRAGGTAVDLDDVGETAAFSLAAPGTWDVSVTLRDDVGNVAENVPVGTVNVDGEGPGLLSAATLVLRPPPGGRLTTVTALAVGGTVEVFFALTEPVAALPVVTASGATAIHPLERIAGDVVAFTYRLQVPAGAQTGPHDIAARVTDQAGNVVDLALGTIEVDVDRPARPTPDAMTFTRKPTRLAGDRFTIAAPAGTFEPAAVVVLRSDPRPDFGFDVASASADQTGGLLAAAGNEDRARVFAVQIDGAGNESEASLVRTVEVVIDLENKVAGSQLVNPHRASLFGDRPRSPRSTGLPILQELDGRDLGDPDGLVVTHRAVATWRTLQVETPQRFQFNSVAWDSARGVAVRTGGQFGGGALKSRTWFWDGRSWESTDPIGGPTAFGALVFDAARELTVFNGVQDAFTWTFDGTRWSPRAVPGPAPILGGATSYDEATSRVLYFAGAPFSDADLATNALWAWDGAAWEQLAFDETEPQPPERIGAVMAPLPEGGHLMFGGLGVSDTWIFDGRAWTEQAPTIDPPSPPLSLVMASSPETVMLVAAEAPVARTFFWSDGDWVEGPEVAGAPVGFGGALTWNPIEGVFLLVINDRTFVFDGNQWHESGAGPGPRHNAVFVADVDEEGKGTGPFLVTGGSAGPGENWLLDGDEWTRLPDAQAFTSPRAVFTGTDNLIVDATGVYRRVGDTWSQVGTAPPATVRGAAWDATANELVVVATGSPPTTATWTLAGGWVALPAFTPSPNEAMAFDPVSSQVLLLTLAQDGLAQRPQTWTWSGTAWAQKPDASSAVRDHGRLVVDASRGDPGQLLAIGGFSTSLFGVNFVSGVEGWTGTTWEPIPTETELEGRKDPAVAFRPDLDRVAVFGGDLRTDGDSNDLRVLDHERAPTVVLDVVLAATQLPVRSLANISARCVASGTGGIRTSVFVRPGAWRELARDETAVQTPRVVEGTLTDPADVRAATHGPSLHLACEAMTPQDNAEVSVDHVQVVLRYLLDED